MRTTRPLIALITGGALALTACGGPSTTTTSTSGAPATAEPAPSGGTVTMAVTDDPGNLDPSMTVLSVTRGIDRVAYDSLVRLNPKGEVVPNLATKWTVEPTKVTFTLNPDVKCSDGTRFTAKDAADNLAFVSNPANKSPLLGVVVPVGLTSVGDDTAHTLTVTAAEPNAFLLRSLTSMLMVCRAGLDDPKKLATATIGTGPWVLKTAAANDSYTFTRNTNYTWGPSQKKYEGAGVPNTLVFRIIPNLTTTANLLLSGEINIAAVGSGDEARIKAAGLKSYAVAAPLGETFFNQAPGHPGADPEVRKALIAASDIPALMKVGTGDSGQVSKGLVTIEPKACPGDTVKGNVPAFDATEANRILDAAGWVKGADGIRAKGGKTLTLKFIFAQRGGNELSAAAELLAQQWKAVGADVKPGVIESTKLNEVLFASGDWDAGWIPVTVSLPTQLPGFLSGPTPPNGTNFAFMNDATYAAKSAEALKTGDEAAACALWNDAEASLIKNQNIVPMFDILASVYLNKVTLDAPTGDIDGSSILATK